MSFFNLLRRLADTAANTNRPRRGQPRRRPWLEVLEDRLAPATAVWTGHGADNNWTTAANWLRNGVAAAPVAGDTLSFGAAGALQHTNHNDFPTDTLFASLSFNSSTYVLGGNEIRLSSGISTSGTAAGFNLIELNLQFTANQTFNISGSAELDIGGLLDDGATPRTLTKAGPGLLAINGPNTYHGLTTVSAGTLEVGDSLALGGTAAGTIVAPGATLALNGFAVALKVPENLTLNGAGVGGLGALRDITSTNSTLTDTLTGTIKLATTSTVGVDKSNVTLRTTGVISGTGGLTKLGQGTLQLSGNLDNTYSGTTTVNGGTLELNNGGFDGAIAGPLVIGDANAGIKVVRLLQDSEIPNGTPVTVNATGFLDLHGHSETIGALQLAGGNVTTGKGLLTLNGNVTTTAAAVSATISGNLDLGSVTRTFTVADGAAANDLVISANIGSDAVTGAMTKAGAGKMVLQGSNLYSGATLINAGILEVQSNTALGDTAGSTTVAAGATLSVNGDGLSIAENLIVNGTGVGGRGALRDVTNIGLPELNHISLSGTVKLSTASIIGVDIADDTLTLSNVVSGNGSLTKLGAGRLALSGTNTYAGATSVNGGTVVVMNSAALGSVAAGTTVAAGATLALDGSVAALSIAEKLTLNGAGVGGLGALHDITSAASAATNTISGTINLATTATVGVDDTDVTLTLNNNISGAGGLTKAGAGILQLAGTAANTFTGTTTVNGGTLELHNGAVNGAIVGPLVIGDGSGSSALVRLLFGEEIPNTVPITINAAAELDLNGKTETIGPLTLAGGGVSTGAGVLILNGNVVGNGLIPSGISGNMDLGSVSRTFTVNGFALRIDAAISGTGGITKAGTGLLSLGGANSYEGATLVNAGQLEVTSNTALGSSTAGGTTVAAGAGLSIYGSPTPLTIAENLTLNGAGVGGFGALRDDTLANSSTTNTLTGTIKLATTTTIGVDDPDVTLALTGVVSGAAGLTKVSPGTLQLGGSSSNTYSGTTTVNGGTLELNNSAVDGAIHSPLVIGDGVGNTEAVRLLHADQIADTVPVTINSTGSLQLNGFNDTLGPLTLSGGGVDTGAGTLLLNGAVNESGQATISGNLDLGAVARTITVAGGAELDIDAAISGSVGFTKAGTGRLVLTGNNTYTGLTTVSSGTLSVQSSTALGSTAAGTIVALGASLEAIDNGSHPNIGEGLTLNGSGMNGAGAVFSTGGNIQLSGDIHLSSSTVISIPQGNSMVMTGVVSSASPLAALIKQGAGVLRLANANTYAGGTTVAAGTLDVTNNTGWATGTGLVTVESGAFLTGGGGTVGDVRVKAGGIVEPINNLTVDNIIFDPWSSFEINLNSTDHLTVFGVAFLGGARLVIVNLNFVPSGSYRIISNFSQLGVIGVFPGFPEGGQVWWLSTPSMISYTGGDGNDVVVTVF